MNEHLTEQQPLTPDLDQMPALAPIVAQLSSWGVKSPPDLLLRLSALTAPVRLADLTSLNPKSVAVVEAWTILLNRLNDGALMPPEDEIPCIALLMFFQTAFDRGSQSAALYERELQKKLTPRGRPLNLGGSWFEATRRLSGRLFSIARVATLTERNAQILEKCVDLFTFLLEKDRKSSEPLTRSMCLGMRGVSNFYLARIDNTPIARYSAACSDLEESGALGDRSVEHDHYLSDAYLHLYDLNPALELLTKAELLVSEMAGKHPPSRQLSFALGEVNLRRGFLLAKSGDVGQAVTFFQSAADDFSRALELPEELSFRDDQIDYVRMKRGHARLRLFTSQHSSGGAEDEALLDLAIEDLDRGGSALPAALLLRSILLRKRKDFHAALRDLERALPLSSDEIDTESSAGPSKWRIMSGIGECNVWLGIEQDDYEKVKFACEMLLQIPTTLREMNTASLFYGIKFLLPNLTTEAYPLVEMVVTNIEARLSTHESDGESRRFDASHAAGLLISVIDRSADTADLERAYRLYEVGLSASDTPADAELYGRAGDTALKLAKAHLRKGQRQTALDYLQDAADLFSEALSAADAGRHSEFFSTTVAHSKLGETFVRLNALSGRVEHANNAIRHLAMARSLGNDSPEILGLLGDAHYRRGRTLSSREDLQEAIVLKQASKAMGLAFRENGSVRAAANLRLWEITQDVRYMEQAIDSAFDAIESDETWPWPVFQLAEFAAYPTSIRRQATENFISQAKHSDLISDIRLGRTTRLYQKACDLALNNTEFDKAEFQSRQLVYVFDDPHRLLKKSFVFKHTPRENADREVNRLRAFGTYLLSKSAPNYFELPEPVLVSKLTSEEVVYVMRRAHGVQLGQRVVESLRGEATDQNEVFKRAVEYLAHFHAWGCEEQPAQHTTNKIIKDLVEDVLKPLRTLGMKSHHLPQVKDALVSLVTPPLPSYLKKDAHPENWLVTPDNTVVMLDLEATANRPILFEVAQLVEDYPLLEPVDENWNRRLDYCAEYLMTIKRLTGFSWNGAVRETYSAFMLYRALFGLGRVELKRRRGKFAQSSSAMRSTTSREQHYREIIKFLANDGPTETIMQASTLVHNTLKTLFGG